MSSLGNCLLLLTSLAASEYVRQFRVEEGEIRTKIVLDREANYSYSLSAIPFNGDGKNLKVSIEVGDVNDNASLFSSNIIEIGFPEKTPRDSKRQLPPAIDSDLGIFNKQHYYIVRRKTKKAFRLSSQRDREGVLRLDLQVNGFLDREAKNSYEVIIEAQDGGALALKYDDSKCCSTGSERQPTHILILCRGPR